MRRRRSRRRRWRGGSPACGRRESTATTVCRRRSRARRVPGPSGANPIANRGRKGTGPAASPGPPAGARPRAALASLSMPAIARVEPLTTARALRGPFDYLVPDHLAGVGEGSLLVVPFGRRRVLGVVVGMAERSDVPPERLVAPLPAPPL